MYSNNQVSISSTDIGSTCGIGVTVKNGYIKTILCFNEFIRQCNFFSQKKIHALLVYAVDSYEYTLRICSDTKETKVCTLTRVIVENTHCYKF